MDSLDIRLLRAYFPGEIYRLEGIEPRRSVQALARAVRTSRITVRRRLTQWCSDGFWNGIVAYPNPDALGARMQTQAIIINGGQDRPRVEKAIQDILQPVVAFQVENLYGPVFFSHPFRESARRQRALRRAVGPHQISPLFYPPFPRSAVALRGSDWRILQALRKSPVPVWAKIAEEVGMTLRGLMRRINRLMEGHALFFHPLLDFRRLRVSVAWVGLLYTKDADPGQLWAEVTARHPDAFRVAPGWPLEEILPHGSRAELAGGLPFFLPAPSGSAGDQFRRELGGMTGVVDVLVGFPTQNTTVLGGLDGRIEASVKEQSSAR